jgi:hypothetical protein
MSSQPKDSLTGNLFLDHLPPDSMDAIRAALTSVSLKRAEILYQPKRRNEDSCIPRFEHRFDGSGNVGRRHGRSRHRPSAQHRAMVLVPNSAKSLPVADLRDALEADPDFRKYALRYVQASMNAGTQLSACNSLHTTNERCARRLLTAHDRVHEIDGLAPAK